MAGVVGEGDGMMPPGVSDSMADIDKGIKKLTQAMGDMPDGFKTALVKALGKTTQNFDLLSSTFFPKILEMQEAAQKQKEEADKKYAAMSIEERKTSDELKKSIDASIKTANQLQRYLDDLKKDQKKLNSELLDALLSDKKDAKEYRASTKKAGREAGKQTRKFDDQQFASNIQQEIFEKMPFLKLFGTATDKLGLTSGDNSGNRLDRILNAPTKEFQSGYMSRGHEAINKGAELKSQAATSKFLLDRGLGESAIGASTAAYEKAGIDQEKLAGLLESVPEIIDINNGRPPRGPGGGRGKYKTGGAFGGSGGSRGSADEKINVVKSEDPSAGDILQLPVQYALPALYIGSKLDALMKDTKNISASGGGPGVEGDIEGGIINALMSGKLTKDLVKKALPIVAKAGAIGLGIAAAAALAFALYEGISGQSYEERTKELAKSLTSEQRAKLKKEGKENDLDAIALISSKANSFEIGTAAAALAEPTTIPGSRGAAAQLDSTGLLSAKGRRKLVSPYNSRNRAMDDFIVFDGQSIPIAGLSGAQQLDLLHSIPGYEKSTISDWSKFKSSVGETSFEIGTDYSPGSVIPGVPGEAVAATIHAGEQISSVTQINEQADLLRQLISIAQEDSKAMGKQNNILEKISNAPTSEGPDNIPEAPKLKVKSYS